MFFFLAFRNITRNKKNSAIIALLIAVITFLFFIGNSITGKAEQSIRTAYVESLTGDVVLEKAGDITMNLFGANTPVIDEYFAVPVLPAYDAVMELVSAEAGIAGITSQVSGKAVLDMMGVRETVLLCGVDAGSYFSLFPGIELESGRFLQAGEYGAMITKDLALNIERKNGQFPETGAPLLLTSGGSMGFKIREVPLTGIFSYQNPGQFMDMIVIIDPQTVRALNSIQVAGTAEAGKNATQLLSVDIDDIFGESFVFGGGDGEEGFSADVLRSFLIEPDTESAAETGGDWNFIILRLKNGRTAASFISSLNSKLMSYGLTAVNWRIAAGLSAILLLLVQSLYNIGVFLISLAGVIAMINILLIAVFRRTREIGTLRAIGASDAYIRSLIFSENLIISAVAGFAGVLGGFFFMRWVNGIGFHITNELIVSMLGGPVLRLEFLPGIAVFSFLIAVVLGLTASIYPVETAVRIEPMVAVRRG
jgi:ABC-type lipoprotein release transport system permease subunit